MEPLELQFSRDTKVVIITIIGSLDGNTSIQFTPFLDQHLDDEDALILLDASKLTFISSAGLRELLGVARRVGKHNAIPAITGMCSSVAVALEIAGFDTLFHRTPDVAYGKNILETGSVAKKGLLQRLFSNTSKS